MPPSRLLLLTLLTLVAFAANSVLCRLALFEERMDPALFTLLRLTSGALVLILLCAARRPPPPRQGDWGGALYLVTYGAAFSFAYLTLTAGTGALLLFAAVQLSMLAPPLLRGERLPPRQWAGLLIAMAGLIVLLLYCGLLYLTYYTSVKVPKGFIPDQDQGYLLVNVQLPDSASVQRTQAVMARRWIGRPKRLSTTWLSGW